MLRIVDNVVCIMNVQPRCRLIEPKQNHESFQLMYKLKQCVVMSLVRLNAPVMFTELGLN